MNQDPGATELDTFSETPRSPSRDEPENRSRRDEVDSIWSTGRKPLVSGMLGLNLFLLGAALVTGKAFNPNGLKNAEPQVFIVMLMGVSLIWMLWYLLWARNQPDISPHKDHHAGGITVTCRFLYNIRKTKCIVTFILDSVIKCTLYSALSQWASLFSLQSVCWCSSSGLVI